MQQDNEQGAAGRMSGKSRMSGMSGRSSVERLPLAVRNAVDAATADGNTIDEIAAVIRVRGANCDVSFAHFSNDGARSESEAVPPSKSHQLPAASLGSRQTFSQAAFSGSDCSRSAVGRYFKRERDLIRQQREAVRNAESWVRTLEDRAEARTGLIATEALRTLTLFSAADLGENGEPVTTEEVARLALALRHIEGADRLRAERERAMAGAVARAGEAARRAGLSAKTVAAIRRAIEGES